MVSSFSMIQLQALFLLLYALIKEALSNIITLVPSIVISLIIYDKIKKKH